MSADWRPQVLDFPLSHCRSTPFGPEGHSTILISKHKFRFQNTFLFCQNYCRAQMTKVSNCGRPCLSGGGARIVGKKGRKKRGKEMGERGGVEREKERSGISHPIPTSPSCLCTSFLPSMRQRKKRRGKDRAPLPSLPPPFFCPTCLYTTTVPLPLPPPSAFLALTIQAGTPKGRPECEGEGKRVNCLQKKKDGREK